jgi:hypothetical protein
LSLIALARPAGAHKRENLDFFVKNGAEYHHTIIIAQV